MTVWETRNPSKRHKSFLCASSQWTVCEFFMRWIFLMTLESIMSLFIKITICVRSKQTEGERIINCRLSPLPAQFKILFLGKSFSFLMLGRGKFHRKLPPLRPWINRCSMAIWLCHLFGIYFWANFFDFLGSFIDWDRRGWIARGPRMSQEISKEWKCDKTAFHRIANDEGKGTAFIICDQLIEVTWQIVRILNDWVWNV